MPSISLNRVITQARFTLSRFPLALFSSIAAAVCMISFIHDDPQQKFFDYLGRMAMTFSLGIPLFLSVALIAEQKLLRSISNILLQSIGIALLILYYQSLPDSAHFIDENYYWYFLISASLHLLVAIAPFLFIRNSSGTFWQYNKTLFLRIVLSGIYSATLFIGLAIALAATDHLFDVIKLNGKVYPQLWFLVMGVFNTWFFLSGIPKTISSLEEVQEYPHGLKNFCQFLLLPIVSLYFVILYVYMGKIVVLWSLPVGWLSSFIIGASIAGILALLLIYPIRERSENAWIRVYSKYFYLALLPLIILMAVAIQRRISDYGVTIERYFVLLFTIWLFFIALRFTVKPNTSIKTIPTSLFILVLLATFGPFSALSVAERSQTNRLKNILIKNGMFENNKVRQAQQKVDVKDRQEISSISDYLYYTHGLHSIRPWLNTDVSSSSDFVTRQLGLEYLYATQQSVSENGNYYYFMSPGEVLKEVRDFDYIYTFSLNYQDESNKHNQVEIKIRDDTVVLSFDPKAKQLVLIHKQKMPLHLSYEAIVRSLKEPYSQNNPAIPADKMMIEGENESLKAKIFFTTMSEQKGMCVVAGELYLKIK